MKIVINKCFGGFGLSEEAIFLYGNKKGINIIKDKKKSNCLVSHYYIDGNYFSDCDIKRNDPVLVEVVNELGEKADGTYSELKIVEIPDDVEWIIEEYDGKEWISEDHRRWS